MILVCHVISQDRVIKEGPYDLIDTNIILKSVRRLYNISDIVQTPYRRRSDVVCLRGYYL